MDSEFKPDPSDPEYKLFSLDDTLQVKVLDDGSTAISCPNGYSDKRAAVILGDLIQRKISHNDASRAILDMLPLPSPSPGPAREEGVGLFSSFLVQMAEQIPASHPGQTRLVQLILQISQSPKLTMTGDAGLGNGYPLHYSMHEIQIEITEYLQAVFYPEAESLDESLHFVQFLARLTAAGFGGGMPCVGLQMIRKGLEETQNDDPFESFFAMCAASWVILAGRTLYTEVVEAPSESYAGPRVGKELWTFWKKRLRELEESGDKLLQAKAVLGSARRVMDSIEAGMESF